MPEEWANLSPEEKREERFNTWLSPQGIKFSSPKAEKSYNEKVTRLIDVIQLKVPDRVPVCPDIGFFPAYYAGITPEEAMYDYHKLCKAWQNFVLDFEPDSYSSASAICPGKPYEILDYTMYRWPGHGTPPNSPFQCIEGEYMKADEYDDLIRNPSDFWLRVHMPRIFKALEPLRKLYPFTDILEMPATTSVLVPYGTPEIQSALNMLMEAGRESLKWSETVGKCNKEVVEWGYPMFRGSRAKAPFDTIGDTLRGTQGIILDMYRQPDKLLEALDVITPLMIELGVSAANASGNPVVFMPLHKGADGFMSDLQFKTFYWPSLKKVVLGLIEEGLVPYLFAEGAYHTRLETISDLPEGKIIWKFDQTNMDRAKEALGNFACITGNVPSSLLLTGKPEEIKNYCRKLIDIAGKGGGFILTNGASLDTAKPENVRAMIETTKEYGIYK
ncbi:uroporphyrinogen decarboxylase family protein [Chloroflexota bacterium]